MSDTAGETVQSVTERQLHILVAEDEFTAALALEDFLSYRGYRVSLASNGVEALEMHQNDPADAILTDLRMPRMNGKELIHRLRAANPDIPIIVMTGYKSFAEETEEEGLLVLRKPVNLNDIVQTLQKMLKN